MKFMTWNVNGIRTLTQYHPYCDDLHKNYKEILDYLGADIICLQETKISRSKLDSNLALVPGYDSYWSFHRTKSGYSGVVIYIKDHIKLIGAEEGISGVLSGYIPAPTTTSMLSLGTDPRNFEQDVEEAGGDGLSETGAGAGAGTATTTGTGTARLSFESTVADTMTLFPELDNEGRGLILDFGFFVLFNLYCPNETDDQRRPFKMAYYRLLEARVRDLIARGKEVIVMGDMNVVPTELDHCDPEKWKKEYGASDLDERGAFTCWNTKINARPSNYGTRLDFILVTEKLLPWFTSCDRQPQVVGSDHCPVVAEMVTELVLEKEDQQQGQGQGQGQQQFQEGGKRVLKDILDSYGGTTDHPLAARFFDEFSGKQQKLSAFFKKPASMTGTGTALISATATATTTTSALDNKRSAGSQADGDDNVSRKKTFFAPSPSPPTLPGTPPSPAGSGSATTSAYVATRAVASDNIPKPIIKSGAKSGAKSGSAAATKKSSSAVKPSGQQTMFSFFGAPAKKPVKEATSLSTTSKISSSQQQQDSNHINGTSQQSAQSPTLASTSLEMTGSSQESLPASAPASLSSSSSSSSLFSPQDYADWIPGSQDVLPFSINGETTTSKWQSLFTPKTIPKCRFHNLPCTEHTVNKKGPNKGRRFFLCSLPVGPNGDRVGQSPDFRCNYFEWQNPEKKK
ncbi:Class II abasic (AP) endonuclease [Mortierella sp. GBA35]|nr:Class II abasic (AP) endonuclease [Mortierella sp. GBA35]